MSPVLSLECHKNDTDRNGRDCHDLAPFERCAEKNDRELVAGLGIKPWTTWDELLAASNTLKENGIIPIALANEARWAGAF